MSSVLKSKELIQTVYSILNKAESETLTRRELDKIETLTIREKSMLGVPTDVDAKEIERFSNLEHLIINGFEIDDELMEIINHLQKLRTIQFTQSRFKTQTCFNAWLDYVIFDRCLDATKVIGNGKRIRIIGQNQSVLDMNELGDLSQTEELFLNDLSVKNISRVLKLANLSTLDLRGSNIDDAKPLARLSLKTKLNDEYLII